MLAASFFFLNPFTMIIGGALVASPIIIHLINRMRYKRIRWAAMEFLLKSQKRNRRRLIIEQLILLLLRILLVLLAAFLVARFLYAGAASRGATHVVVIDDTMSMLDRGKAGNVEADAFNVGIAQIRQLVEKASKAPSTQNMSVYLLSEMDRSPFWEGKLSNVSAEEISQKFAARGNRAGLRHAKPLAALQKGRQFLANVSGEMAQGQKVLHFVSDFRDSDWTTGPDAEKLAEEVRGVLNDGINLNLIDTSLPYRNLSSKSVLFSDNLSILDLKADTRVAIEESDVDLIATVKNFGQTEAQGKQLRVYVNGEHDLARDQIIDRLPAGEVAQVKFSLRFPKRAKVPEINEKDGPEERERKRRLDREYYNVRVTIPREEAGLNADNVRDLVIEVRKKVPSLVVDGNKPEGRAEAGDMYHLQAFYAASGVYEIEERRLQDLEKADLDLYPSIFLLNVAEIPPAIVKRLKQYVENGGSLCYFMGEEVKPEHYNADLFKAGIFPLQITDRAHDPLAAAFPDPEARQKERERLRQTDPTPKILFPKADHPLVARLSPFRTLFRFLSVNVYWKALPRGQWDPEPRRAETLVVLPNAGEMNQYKARALDLSNQAEAKVKALAVKEKEIARFINPLEAFGRKIRNALSAGELFRLSEVLDDMLKNSGVKDDAEKPNMLDLWKHAEMRALATEISEFREQVLYGDPLVVSRTVGKGRVVAMLTPAGTSLRKGVAGEETVAWNNWGAGERLVSQTYPLFLLDMQRYLVSEGEAPNRLLGEEVNFAVDVTRYDPKVTWTFTPQPDMSAEAAKIDPEKDKGVMTRDGNRLLFNLKDAGRPGVFQINLTLLGDGPEEDRQERRSYAYNVDAASESPLKRATADRMIPDPAPTGADKGKVTIKIPEGDTYEEYTERKPDASEWPWLYLFIIIILVVEQALAVHLSHHTRGAEGAPADSAAPGPTPAAA